MKNIRTFRIENELWIKLKEKSEKEGLTPSIIIRKSIKNYLKLEKNDIF